jgi:hypothetical protein
MHPFLLVQATANRTCGSRRSGGAKSIAGYGDPKTRERRRSATTVDVEPPRARVPVADEWWWPGGGARRLGAGATPTRMCGWATRTRHLAVTSFFFTFPRMAAQPGSL